MSWLIWVFAWGTCGGFVMLLLKSHMKTRACVYKTLCPLHMLAPKNSTEMIPNLQRAITPEKIDGISSKANQVIYSSSPISWSRSSGPLMFSSLTIFLPACLCVQLTTCLSINVSAIEPLFTCQCLPAFLPIYPPVCLSFLPAGKP